VQGEETEPLKGSTPPPQKKKYPLRVASGRIQ
jgi:hypothetical protein